METNQNGLEKLSKQKLIEMIKRYQERLATMEECASILRIGPRRS
jgi:hypothetical protein